MTTGDIKDAAAVRADADSRIVTNNVALATAYTEGVVKSTELLAAFKKSQDEGAVVNAKNVEAIIKNKALIEETITQDVANAKQALDKAIADAAKNTADAQASLDKAKKEGDVKVGEAQTALDKAKAEGAAKAVELAGKGVANQKEIEATIAADVAYAKQALDKAVADAAKNTTDAQAALDKAKKEGDVKVGEAQAKLDMSKAEGVAQTALLNQVVKAGFPNSK